MIYQMEATKDQPGAPDYHNPESYYYRMPFNLALFQQAVDSAVQRHAVLRTSFDFTSFSEPLQLVHKTVPFIVEADDIRQYSLIEQEQLIKQFVARESNTHFDMTRAPLLRFHIHRRTDDAFQFSLTEFHPIIDGWSLHSILKDIFNHYLVLLKQGERDAEEPVETTFRDFVALEKMALQSQACQDYWARKLADYNRLELPRWTQTTPQPGEPRYSKIEIALPLDLAASLRQLARSASVPLKTLLFAAHVRVMSLLSGQTDILTGQLSHGRLEVVGGDRVSGLFLNILPLRLALNGGNWLDLAHQTFDTECELLPFRRYPLAEMQRRWGGRTPLLDTVFSYFDFHVFNDFFASAPIEDLGWRITSHNVGFVLNALFFASTSEIRRGEIFFYLAYETARISEQDARRVGEYYLAVMRAMTSNPQEQYGAACVLPVTETTKLLKEWNPPVREEEDRCPHQLFEEQARRTPHLPALVQEEQSLSYAELEQRATHLAHLLRQQGVGTESLVGLCLPRSFELVVGLLAILKAGASCVPLDPDYPAARLSFLMQDADLALLLTTSALVERLPAAHPPLLCLDQVVDETAQASWETALPPVSAEQIAYVVYTSGSTGTPKGVLLRHRSLTNRIRWGQQVHPLSSADRVLQEASFSFDFALWEFFGPLSVGAQVILPRPGGQREIDYLLTLIERHQITVLHLIPSLLRVFLEQPDLRACASVRHVYGGAEALPYELWQRYRERFAAPLHNVYGPTEATIDTTCWSATRESEETVVLIGRPLSNVEVYLLDRQMQPVPIGVPGEIYIGGAGLARGYLHRPDLTAERFVPHPFGERAGARLYRTGDQARYRRDGNLEYLGRVDQQVKVRGFRIELGELESVLTSHPGVQQAVAQVREDRRGERRLVAYVVPQPGQVVLPTDLRQFLQQRVPDYMLPSSFLSLTHLPLTAHGKLDRQALPEPGEEQIIVDHEPAAPRGILERLLVFQWKDILDQTHIGIHDDFFELGGDSLIAIQLVTRLRAAFHIKITPQDLMEAAPTIADLSAMLSLRLAEQIGNDAAQQLFVELEPLSEDEAWSALSENEYIAAD
jgi:amino acid adenylation domain-containing protein